MADDETITFTAAPWRASVLPQPLRFPPPYARYAADKEGFSYWWQLFRWVFDLPDPHKFPPLPAFAPQEREILVRFLDTCEELAESTLLSYGGGLQVRVENGEESITADEPPREAIRGCVVLFRQMTSEEEPASYSAVRKIIGRAIHDARDEHFDQRDEWQRRWNRARAALMGGLLTSMADRKVVNAMHGANSDQMPVGGEDVRPTELLSLFQYGELIHWGKNREALGELMKDDFMHKWQMFHFLEVVIQLSHFYLGYSVIVRRALGLPTHSHA